MTSSSLTTPAPTKDKGHGSERSVPGKETKGNKKAFYHNFDDSFVHLRK